MSDRIFEVNIRRNLDGAQLGWPERGEAMPESTLGGNQSYCDLRGIRWREVGEVLTRERVYLDRLLSDQINEDDLDEELWSAADRGEPPLEGLDPGVASAVFALSASGAVTAYSCNGGAFGNRHNSKHPVVAFFTRQKMVPLLLACAEKADIGLENATNGIAIAYADRVTKLYDFAVEIYENRSSFNRLKRNISASSIDRHTSESNAAIATGRGQRTQCPRAECSLDKAG